MAETAFKWDLPQEIISDRGPAHNVRLIEWGHKVSFAYVTADGLDDDKLYGLAKNIAVTGQLLCSSCQGVYVDTEDSEEVYAFCRRFLPLLEKAVAEYAGNMEIGTRTQEEAELTDLLLRCGVVRISPGERMSETYPGAPHDGEYPLRRYTRVASVVRA